LSNYLYEHNCLTNRIKDRAYSLGNRYENKAAERGVLVVPFARTASMQNRAFSVADPKVCNGITQELRLLPRLCTDTFLGHLRTYLFVRTGVGRASE